MLVDRVTEFGIIADRVKIAGFRIFTSVMADCRKTECCTVWAGPNRIRMTELIKNVLCRNGIDVGIQIDIFKIFAPFDAVNLMAVSLECFADTTCTGE